MTNQIDVAGGNDIVARWYALAEQRLQYLTELFETGRWRRYHSERAFLENIQDAKRGVELWHDLLTREARRDNSAIDIGWLGRPRATLSGSDGLRNRATWLQPRPAQILPESPQSDVSMVAEAGQVASEEVPCAPAIEEAAEPTLDSATIQERYPSLRNALL